MYIYLSDKESYFSQEIYYRGRYLKFMIDPVVIRAVGGEIDVRLHHLARD